MSEELFGGDAQIVIFLEAMIEEVLDDLYAKAEQGANASLR